MYYDNNIFEKSLKLPLPSKKKLILIDYTDSDYKLITTDGKVDRRMEELVNDWGKLLLNIRYNEFDKILGHKYNSNTNDEIKLEILNLILTRLEYGNKEMIISKNHLKNDGSNKSYLTELIDVVNNHNLYKTNVKGFKNYATYQMHSVLNDPRNATTTYKSIDVAINAFSKPIKKLPDSITYNLDDGHSISSITVSGAVGKDGVGIAANGTKVSSTILNYLNRKFETDEPITEEQLVNSHHFNILKINIPYNSFDGEKKNWNKTLGPISDTIINSGIKKLYTNWLLNTGFQIEFINSHGLSDAFKISRLTTEEFLKSNFLNGVSLWEMFEKEQSLYIYDRDATQGLGTFVSMSADNAKTLYLDKLNAIQDFFAMHIFLTMNGCPEDVIVQFFNSPVISLLKESLKKDVIFDEKITRLNQKTFKSVRLFINRSDMPDVEKYDLLNQLKNVEILWKYSGEITDAARILSINQGIKVEEQEIVKQNFNLKTAFNLLLTRRNIKTTGNESLLSTNIIKNIVDSGRGPKSYITLLLNNANEKIKKFNETHEDIKVGVNLEFDLNAFLNDPEYREVIKSITDVVKFNINIFDIIDSAPHFKLMFEKYNQLLRGYTKVCKVLDFEINEAPKLYDKNILYIKLADPENGDFVSDNFDLNDSYNAEYTKYAKNAWYTQAFEKFLLEYCSKYSFKYKNTSKNSSGILYSKNISCDFKSENAILNFMEFMSSYVFPALYNNYYDNAFVRTISINEQLSKKYQRIYFEPKENLKIKQSKSVMDAIEFNNIKNDLEKIKDVTLDQLLGEGMSFLGSKLTIGDALFIYNTLISQANIKLNNFSPVLIQYGQSDLNTKYANFIRDIDTKKIKLDVDLYVLMGTMVKNKLRRSGNNKYIIYKLMLPNNDNKILWTSYKGENIKFQRFTMTLPYNEKVPDELLLSEKFINAINNGDISIEVSENCK